jgi:chromate transporter
LIVEPDDGLEPVLQFIASAQESLLVKQFTFTDETLIQAVINRRLTMIGYAAGLHVGGVPGAILGGVIATAAMVIPAASLVYAITLFWQKAEQSNWRIAVEKGFAPLTVGLILASSLVMSRAADHDWKAYSLTAICTLIFVRTKLNPLFVVAVAGVIGYFGIV